MDGHCEAERISVPIMKSARLVPVDQQPLYFGLFACNLERSHMLRAFVCCAFLRQVDYAPARSGPVRTRGDQNEQIVENPTMRMMLTLEGCSESYYCSPSASHIRASSSWPPKNGVYSVDLAPSFPFSFERLFSVSHTASLLWGQSPDILHHKSGGVEFLDSIGDSLFPPPHLHSP
ncbi:predicted protein [Plenodomus lingam JN3]|uniref:Predicted protein n=1 Tax=Leptosphaeria maculans (strain JN3 / isolate v23.1.3 / race Av1-4-5-6-7-8) TaxID=985895 RepID=E4ZNV1_LEPMJ|nr:predicted protein [Plenodomus lingam JN3]CBX93320.1 predicted protein [Plenodomus lingam JN3]